MIRTDVREDDRTQPDLEDRYDVIVLGGGPAGAAAAAITAEAGYSTLVLERAPAGRFHVGESLIPESYWSLERLGMLDKMRAHEFTEKRSVQFVNEHGRESAPFYFDDHKTSPSNITWQVERGEFDRLLQENAEENGAAVRTDAHVMDVLWDGDRAAGVKVRLGRDRADRVVREIESTVLIDATGQSAFIANRLGCREADPQLKNGTIWTYWRDAERSTEPRDEGCTVILSGAEKKTWFWYIPLGDGVTSVGCTGAMSYMFGKHRGTAEETYMSEVARCPGIQKRIAGAERVYDFYSTKDFSYYSTRGAGDGWVLVGDAFGFIDPVYSSGVFLALRGGVTGGEAVVQALAAGDTSGTRLGAWQPDYKAGIENFRKLVYAFYSPDFSLGEFVREHPQFRSGVTDVLIGDVFKPDLDPMFEAMGDLVLAPTKA
ncbi:MAG: tryptophan 7-halogenase [Planctomycetota bacterium]